MSTDSAIQGFDRDSHRIKTIELLVARQAAVGAWMVAVVVVLKDSGGGCLRGTNLFVRDQCWPCCLIAPLV